MFKKRTLIIMIISISLSSLWEYTMYTSPKHATWSFLFSLDLLKTTTECCINFIDNLFGLKIAH